MMMLKLNLNRKNPELIAVAKCLRGHDAGPYLHDVDKIGAAENLCRGCQKKLIKMLEFFEKK